MAIHSTSVGVFQSRAPALDGADIRFVKGDVRQVHAQMKSVAGSRNIWVVGGEDLAGQFYDAGLLDELIVKCGSATLGKGKPLFPRRDSKPKLAVDLCSADRQWHGRTTLRNIQGE